MRTGGEKDEWWCTQRRARRQAHAPLVSHTHTTGRTSSGNRSRSASVSYSPLPPAGASQASSHSSCSCCGGAQSPSPPFAAAASCLPLRQAAGRVTAHGAAGHGWVLVRGSEQQQLPRAARRVTIRCRLAPTGLPTAVRQTAVYRLPAEPRRCRFGAAESTLAVQVVYLVPCWRPWSRQLVLSRTHHISSPPAGLPALVDLPPSQPAGERCGDGGRCGAQKGGGGQGLRHH